MGTNRTSTDERVMLDAALDAFAEHGFDGTSVRDIARNLGVSHNLLPQRFGSKDRLWRAAVDHGFAEVARHIHIEVVPDDPFETLRNTIVAFVEATARRPEVLRILNQEAATPGPRLDYLYERHVEPATVPVERSLEALQRHGLARPIPRAGFYFLLTHAAAGPLALSPLSEKFGHRISADDPAGLREYALSIADLLIHGIADGSSRAARTLEPAVKGRRN